jgi:hypothetical protein
VANPGLVEVFFDDRVESVLTKSLGDDRYQLVKPPLGSDLATFGDVVEATRDPHGVLLVRLLVSSAGFCRFEFALPREVIGSQGLADFCEAVMQEGGNWERVFTGLLIVHLLPDSSFDPEEEIKLLVEITFSRQSKR